MSYQSQTFDDYSGGIVERLDLRQMMADVHRKIIRNDDQIAQRLARYQTNKAAKTGDTIYCAFCNAEMVKTHPSRIFCAPNPLIKGTCQTRYHLSVDADKWARARQFNEHKYQHTG